jgi:hypothetical protein
VGAAKQEAVDVLGVGVVDEGEREDNDDSAELNGEEEATEIEVKDIAGVELVMATGVDTTVEEKTTEEV